MIVIGKGSSSPGQVEIVAGNKTVILNRDLGKNVEKDGSVGGDARLSVHRSTIEMQQDSPEKVDDKMPLYTASQVHILSSQNNNRAKMRGGGKRIDGIDFVSSYINEAQLNTGTKRLLSNPNRALDRYKKSFGSKTGLFYKEHRSVLEVTGQAKSPINEAPSLDINCRFANRNQRNSNGPKKHSTFARNKSNDVPLPYAAKTKNNDSSQHKFAVSQKFPKRSMPPQRSSLLLSQLPASGGGASNISAFQPFSCTSPTYSDLDDRSPLHIKKKDIQQAASSIKTGQYDTLRCLNEAQDSQKRLNVDSSTVQTVQKVLKKPIVQMFPVNRSKRSVEKIDNLKSTLSNQSLINKLCSTNRDIPKSSDIAQLLEQDHDSAISDSTINKWKTQQLTSQNLSKEGAVALGSDNGRNSKVLEIKGSDGDQVMILQFDKKQLQVFNKILDQKMQDQDKKSQDNKSEQSQEGQPVTSHNKHHQNESCIQSKSLEKIIAQVSNQEELNLFSNQSRCDSPQVVVGDRSKLRNGNQTHLQRNTPNDLKQVMEQSPTKNQLHWIELKAANSMFRNDSYLSSNSRSGSSVPNSRSRSGKKPVNLNDVVRSWNEESRISSPSAFGAPNDSPKPRFYLGSPKYKHTHRDQTAVFSIGSGNAETVGLLSSDRDASSHRKFSNDDKAMIHSKELGLQIDSPKSKVHSPSSGSTAGRQPKSFLQHLTRQFGPTLVSEYLLTKNVISMRKLIKLEQSQHCRCPYRKQVNEYLNSLIDSGILPSDRQKSVSPGRGKAVQASGPCESEIDVASIHSRYEQIVTEQPCRNCISQINFSGLLHREYQKQLQQKLQPVQYNQLIQQQQVLQTQMAKTARSDAISQKSNKLHHARYFKKQVEEKEVRNLKQQTMLRKARQSTVLRVQPMTNVKSFDMHIQQCLTVKNDSVLHRAALKKGGHDMGFIYPSVMSRHSNSSLSQYRGAACNEIPNSEGLLKLPLRRTSCEFNQKNHNESVSTPSISPSPMMVLNPKQEPLENGDKPSMLSSSSKNFSKRKFTLGKTRNGSTLTGGGRGNTDYQSNPNNIFHKKTSLRDQLSRVLGSNSFKERDMVRKSCLSQETAVVQPQSCYEEQQQKSIIEYNCLERSVPAPFIGDDFGNGAPNQLDKLKAITKANNRLKIVDLQSKLPNETGAVLTSIGASTHKLEEFAENPSFFGLNPNDTQDANREATESCMKIQEPPVVNSQRKQRKSLVLTKPHILTSKIIFEQQQSNRDSHRVVSSQNSSSNHGGSSQKFFEKLHFKTNSASSSQGLDQNQDYKLVNFRGPKQVDIELEKFFKRARKSALKQTYKNLPSTTTGAMFANSTDFHNSGDQKRRGLKSQQQNRPRVRKPFEAIKNNTRYCVSRERGQEHATFLVDASQQAIKNLISQEKTRGAGSNQVFSSQKSTKKYTVHSRSLSKTSQNQTRSFNNTQNNLVEFQALKPTVLTPSSGLSISLNKEKDITHYNIPKPNERCVKVNQHHIVVKEKPRKMRQLLYTALLDSDQQQKFLITDQNAAFFN